MSYGAQYSQLPYMAYSRRQHGSSRIPVFFKYIKMSENSSDPKSVADAPVVESDTDNSIAQISKRRGGADVDDKPVPVAGGPSAPVADDDGAAAGGSVSSSGQKRSGTVNERRKLNFSHKEKKKKKKIDKKKKKMSTVAWPKMKLSSAKPPKPLPKLTPRRPSAKLAEARASAVVELPALDDASLASVVATLRDEHSELFRQPSAPTALPLWWQLGTTYHTVVPPTTDRMRSLA
jgi:hypothetical protein